MDLELVILRNWIVLDGIYNNISSYVLILDCGKEITMPGLALTQSTRQKFIQDTERLEPGEYNWIDLGQVGYGLRNDSGSVHIHMKLGVLKGNKPDYPGMVVDVIEKYYGADHGFDYSNPHKVENVIYHKPNNLLKLIKAHAGKDTRTFKEEE